MTFSRYNRKDTVQSIYCYPHSDILINKLDIKDEELLEEAEAEFTGQRLLELQINPVSGKFTLTHLQNIHKYIFQDIYPFAGKLRLEDISKGTTVFARSQHIKSYSTDILNQLKNEKYLIGMDVHVFSNRAAYYMAELNVIHPFREGNGRAIREFIRCLALKCGYILNWDAVEKNKLLEASILSVTDASNLANCIEICVEKN